MYTIQELKRISTMSAGDIYYLIKSCYDVTSAGAVLSKIDKTRGVRRSLAITSQQAMDVSNYIIERSKYSPQYLNKIKQWIPIMEYIANKEAEKKEAPFQNFNCVPDVEDNKQLQLMVETKNLKIKELQTLNEKQNQMLEDILREIACKPKKGFWARIFNKKT